MIVVNAPRTMFCRTNPGIFSMLQLCKVENIQKRLLSEMRVRWRSLEQQQATYTSYAIYGVHSMSKKIQFFLQPQVCATVLVTVNKDM